MCAWWARAARPRPPGGCGVGSPLRSLPDSDRLCSTLAPHKTHTSLPRPCRTLLRKQLTLISHNLSHQPHHRSLIYKDFREGEGSTPVDGQEVIFHYTGFNESGAVIDSSYRQGRPAQTRLGIAGLIPGG